MKKSIHKWILLLVLPVLVSQLSCTQSTEEITTIILIRNAEEVKERNNANPVLDEAGVNRAQSLGILLKDEPLAAIYAVNTESGNQTVEPIALSHNIEVANFEKNDLTIIDNILQFQKGKQVLVATNIEHIPQILNQLVGDTKYDALPTYKYDNMYVIAVLRKGKASITTLKYGNG